jgi:hypothetical protein
MAKEIEIPTVRGFASWQVDAAGKALREYNQASRGLLVEWDNLGNSAKLKWWKLAVVALGAVV